MEGFFLLIGCEFQAPQKGSGANCASMRICKFMDLRDLRGEFSKLLLTSDRALQLQPDSERSCPKR
jgi:hypothetical protein